MTDQTIKDLFYGNLNLFDRPMGKASEYSKAIHEAGEARDALEATMNDEQKKLLNDYIDKRETAACHLEYSAFLVGFKTATRLLSEAIFNKDHE